jgi:hypothetical protein
MEAFMKNSLSDLRPATLIGFLVVLLLIALELINRQDLNLGFPTALFFMLWLLPIVFTLTVLPIIRDIQNRENILAHPISFLVRVIIMSMIALMWINIITDQWGCFVGVPNCD